MSHTIKIVSRYDSSRVLYECEVMDAEHASGIGMRVALEKATKDGANLAGANLAGANLDGANLDGANLVRANLDGACLVGANLAGANLVRANLDGACLVGANLAGANLAGANLDGANLVRANLDGANLDGACLVGANLAGANLAGANLVRANLAGAKIVRKVAQVRRGDGYEFIAFALDDGRTIIRAGCRTMTPEQFREHVAKKYPATPKASETLAIIDFIEARAMVAA